MAKAGILPRNTRPSPAIWPLAARRIQTRANEDAPYWPAANCYNYKEVWVHPASRWLSLAAELDQLALVKVQTTRKFLSSVEIKEVHGAPRYSVAPSRDGRVELRCPRAAIASRMASKNSG